MTHLPNQRLKGEGSPSPLQNEGTFKGLYFKTVRRRGGSRLCSATNTKMPINSRELLRVAINFLLYFQRIPEPFSTMAGAEGRP